MLLAACYLTARMEIPSKVSIFNRTLEIKGKPGTLVAINADGLLRSRDRSADAQPHRAFPVAETVIIFNEALPPIAADFEVER